MLYGDPATGQFCKQFSSITAVKGGHAEHLNLVFKVTTLQCND